MAKKALFYLGFFHAGGFHSNHIEVHHVMAWRSMVALSAVQRSRREMAEFRNAPCDRPMTLCAFLADTTVSNLFTGSTFYAALSQKQIVFIPSIRSGNKVACLSVHV